MMSVTFNESSSQSFGGKIETCKLYRPIGMLTTCAVGLWELKLRCEVKISLKVME